MDLIQRLPEDTSLHDIAKEIEFIAGVREGFEQIEQGEGVPAEEVRRMIPWSTSFVFISSRAIQDLSYIVRYILFGDPKAVFPMPTLSLAN